MDRDKSKKQKESIKMLLKTGDIKNLLMLCLMKKLWDIRWKKIQGNFIELELMMFLKFLCVVLMVKDTY